MARPGRAGHGKAFVSMQFPKAWPGMARRGMAARGKAGHGEEFFCLIFGRARLGAVGPGTAWQG